MAYNYNLEIKLDQLTASWPNLEKKKMFGGLGYLTNGNMVVGISKDHLLLRTNKILDEELQTNPHFETINKDTGKKPMPGWAFISESGWSNTDVLSDLVNRCYDYVVQLPPKKK